MHEVAAAAGALPVRWDELWRRAGDDALDAIVVLGAPGCLGPSADSPGDVRFLTGWTPPFGPSAVVLRRDLRPVVLAIGPHDARGFRARLGDAAEVRQVAGPGVLADSVAGLLEASRTGGEGSAGVTGGAGVTGVAGLSELPAALADALRGALGEPRPVDGHLHALRVRHYADFTYRATAVAAISDAMVERVFAEAAARPCSGAELMILAEQVGRSLGAETAGCWIATGPAPSTTYFEQRELREVLADGDRLQIGTTVRYEGFYGQSLRMAVMGRPPALLEEHARRLVAVQDEIAALMRPGVPLADVAARMAELVGEACPYPAGEDPFRFQFCHGLGLSYSEPAMRAISGAGQADPAFADAVLADGMVVEVHPNYSVPDLGHVCAGDMAQVTPAGAVWLTSSARGLVRLGTAPG
ncbi:M24 family metallopeptidase [Actinomadura rubrisoli]|uniref:M24 family metallopeptidase n=1 Tax=Actinomadura rubrisoli TaxID=2530368 RepID=A0A4R5C4S0_9ACTN|nr:M24 family metallopeptidase [Actinomadura rubrisoli]TDD91852.1 M24 family metallopeptidase [Actinomadura rubrisoli]